MIRIASRWWEFRRTASAQGCPECRYASSPAGRLMSPIGECPPIRIGGIESTAFAKIRQFPRCIGAVSSVAWTIMSRKGRYSAFVKNPFSVRCRGRQMLLRPAILARSGAHSMDIMAKIAFSYPPCVEVRSDRTLFALSVMTFKANPLACFLPASDKWIIIE